ncbi:MAG: hypothetical protein ACYTG7_23985 [Planctomycetota bacterium]|jgi:hypothetical protein
MVFANIKKFIRYLSGKRAEIQDLDARDLLLGKVILDIHRKRTHSEFILAPLDSIRLIHPINRDTSLEETRKRAAVLAGHRQEVVSKRKITRAFLAEYLPSVSWIKVVKESRRTYIAYEGNSRLLAMQQVFKPGDGIEVEVELYHFMNKKEQKKILRRVNRVRKSHGLI